MTSARASGSYEPLTSEDAPVTTNGDAAIAVPSDELDTASHLDAPIKDTKVADQQPQAVVAVQAPPVLVTVHNPSAPPARFERTASNTSLVSANSVLSAESLDAKPGYRFANNGFTTGQKILQRAYDVIPAFTTQFLFGDIIPIASYVPQMHWMTGPFAKWAESGATIGLTGFSTVLGTLFGCVASVDTFATLRQSGNCLLYTSPSPRD